MNEVAKVFLATNSDYKYTEVLPVRLLVMFYTSEIHRLQLNGSVLFLTVENHYLPVRLSSWTKG